MTTDDQKLDQLLSSLPRDVTPTRDLWPAIEAQLPTQVAKKPHRSFGLVAQLAAGFVLIAVSALTTYFLTHSATDGGQIPIAADDGNAIAQEYIAARIALDRQFAERIAQLPATTRAQLEVSLAELRRAENEILANLNANPSDTLLQELLLSTYQTESQLLADMTELRDSDSENIDTSRSTT
jgi:hypothetical protein